MNTVLTLISFVLLVAFVYVLGSAVPRMDLLVVLISTLALAFWDLFVHDWARLRTARRQSVSETDDAFEPDASEPTRHDGRPVEDLGG